MIAAVLADARDRMQSMLVTTPGLLGTGRVIARHRVEPPHPPELLAQVRLEVAALTRCPWRGRKVECGCAGARLCLLMRGESGRVTALDCQRCPVAVGNLLLSLGRALPAPVPEPTLEDP